MSKKKVLLGGTLIACMTALLLLVSCGTKSPTSPYLPSPAPSNALLSDSLSLFDLLNVSTGTFSDLLSLVYLTQLDLAQEKQLTLMPDSVYLVFPANSVPDPVTITISIVRGLNFKNDIITQLDCGPDGLKFNSSLKLRYRSPRPNGTVIKFYWYDENNKVWKLQQTEKVTGGWVVFDINHFSKYTVVEGSASNGSQ